MMTAMTSAERGGVINLQCIGAYSSCLVMADYSVVYGVAASDATTVAQGECPHKLSTPAAIQKHMPPTKFKH